MPSNGVPVFGMPLLTVCPVTVFESGRRKRAVMLATRQRAYLRVFEGVGSRASKGRSGFVRTSERCYPCFRADLPDSSEPRALHGPASQHEDGADGSDTDSVEGTGVGPEVALGLHEALECEFQDHAHVCRCVWCPPAPPLAGQSATR